MVVGGAGGDGGVCRVGDVGDREAWGASGEWGVYGESEEGMGPAVAVVIPAYEAEGTIREVVAGIPEWVRWVIVVDDGSTDRTAEEAGKSVV